MHERRDPRHEVIRRAQQSPFYARHLQDWLKHPDAPWTTLPFTTKEDLRAAYPFGLLAVPRERLATYHESSGTSGEPTSTYFTEADWDDIASRFARNAVELSALDTVLIKTPYSLVTTAHQMHRAARQRGALVIPADNRSSNMPYSKVVRLLRDVGVTVAWCMPSEALIWAEAARRAGLDPARDFPQFRAFVVAGEPLSRARKKRIEEIWGGIRVYEDYGSTETGSLAGECRGGNLHAWADRLYFEVIDPHSRESHAHGIGELAVTPLYREGQPLLRYRLGDRVELGEAICDCGSPHPVIRVLGRAGAEINVGSLRVHASDIEEIVYSLPRAREVLFWRARPAASTLEIEMECPFEQQGYAIRELQDLLRDRLGISSRVRALPPGALISAEKLTETSRFLKPRYVFAEDEDWQNGLLY